MSTPAKHTPGPWHRDGFNLSAVIVLVSETENGKHWDTIARCDGSNWDANSQIIAAAPTMFEAASALIREFDNIYDVDDGQANIPGDLMALVDKLRTALALAAPVLEREGR